MATKTRTKKIDTLHPPREITDNTKARRAWLAEKLAEVNATPNRSGKIVGTGSYQTVSVYEVTEVEGRLRHRGNCQVCGGAQVVDEAGHMVLHGYKRPGDGAVYGRCPGTGEVPQQTDNGITLRWWQQSSTTLAELEAEQKEAEATEKAAFKALYPGNGSAEPGAYQAAPVEPRSTGWRKADPEEVAAYRVAKEAWAKQYPLTAAYSKAKRRTETVNREVWQMKQQVGHFKFWLDKHLPGTPLFEEVVA